MRGKNIYTKKSFFINNYNNIFQTWGYRNIFTGVWYRSYTIPSAPPKGGV